MTDTATTDVSLEQLAEQVALNVEGNLRVDDSNLTTTVANSATSVNSDSAHNINMKLSQLNDKFKGLVLGFSLGAEFATHIGDNTNVGNGSAAADRLKTVSIIQQIIIVLRTFIYNSSFPISIFAKSLFKSSTDRPHYDQFTQDVVSRVEYEKHITSSTIIMDEYERRNEYVSSNIPLLRNVPFGVFKNWNDMSAMQCMSTHIDPLCIASCVIFSSIVRGMITNTFVSVKESVIDITAMVTNQKKLVNDNDINLMCKFMSKSMLTDLNNIKQYPLPENHTFKSLSSALWGLATFIQEDEFVTGDTARQTSLKDVIQSLEFVDNSALTTSLIGCHIGYEKLRALVPVDVKCSPELVTELTNLMKSLKML